MVGRAFRFPNAGKSAPDFVGTDWVAVPDDSVWDLGRDPFTIEMWVNLADTFSAFPHQQPLIGHTEGPGTTNKWILWIENGGLTFHVNGRQAPSFNPLGYDWRLAPGEWHHVAVTRDGASWRLFVDGTNVKTNTDPRAIPGANADLTIGRAEDTWFEGLLDEVAIYDRALSVAEVEAIFRAGGEGRCKP